MDVSEYCRDIERYLCRKNDGHLIRVVGPSFEVVSRWAAQGVPLKVAYAGIDRYFERYYRNGPRRRPVKIDFCDADVLDVFDEWRRAVGAMVVADSSDRGVPNPQSSIPNAQARIPNPKKASVPVHLERAVMRLTAARASGAIGGAFDSLIDRVALELDAARAKPGGLRGEARQRLADRLAAIDAELLALARTTLDPAAREALEREAARDLAPFKAAMQDDAFTRARNAAVDRLVRERLLLPTVSL